MGFMLSSKGASRYAALAALVNDTAGWACQPVTGFECLEYEFLPDQGACIGNGEADNSRENYAKRASAFSEKEGSPPS
jgi:hypothetical protein